MVNVEIINKVISDCISKCHYQTFKYVNSKGETITLHIKELKRPSTFLKYLHNARQTIPAKDRWRVLEPSLENAKIKYANTRLFVTEHGSTIGIDKDGTIISVCSFKDNNGKSYDNAGALMSYAISQGGDKLDTFDGNYAFYRHCGFEPMSWINFEDFDKSYIPEWVEGNSRNPESFKEEDIVFFKYTGAKSKYLTSDDFYKSTAPVTGENAYDRAVQIRNNK